MNRKRLVQVAAAVLIAAAGSFLLLGRSEWKDQDPGVVVILSETELGFATNWFCNPQRFVEEGRTDEEVRVSFQRLRNPQSVKFCGIGDCGWGQKGSADTNIQDFNSFEDLDAGDCQQRYSLAEPIGSREIIVNGDRVESLDVRLAE